MVARWWLHGGYVVATIDLPFRISEAKNPQGDPLWFLIGIQADVTWATWEGSPWDSPWGFSWGSPWVPSVGVAPKVTHVCLEETPEYLPRLHEVASTIRHLDLRCAASVWALGFRWGSLGQLTQLGESRSDCAWSWLLQPISRLWMFLVI